MKHIIFITLFFLPFFSLAEKQPEVINTNYNSVKFIEFVNAVENELNFKFYFQESWIDTIIIKQKDTPSNLNQILDDSFYGSKLNYIIDNKNIIITKNYKITTELPKNFFAIDQKSETSTTDTIDLKYAFIEQAKKKKTSTANQVINIGDPSKKTKGNKAVISGIIRNEEDGEPIIGAQVYSKSLGIGTITDTYGYYLITLPKGNNELLFKYIGRKETTIPIMIYNDGTLDVNMKENLVQLREVVITSKENNVKNLNIGVQRLNIDEVKQLPAIMGEVDIIKTAILLPGVQTVGEGASGFNVRGGSADQNLILFDEAPIFNSSHLFGFFSVFNPETIKDFQLYKSGIPARYGGRISSVFDITAKQGNMKKYVVSGGISPITGKLTLEAPLIKDKLSIIVGARSTYSNWVLKKLDETKFKNSAANFYDISTKIQYEINKNNSLSITGYQSKDYFKLNSDTAYHFENECARLFYKHFFTKKIYGTLSGIYSNYQYNISSDQDPATAFNLKYNIGYKSLKSEFNYFPNTKHTLNFGAEIIRYDMTPGNFTPLDSLSDIISIYIPKEQGLESGLFINDEFKVNDKLMLSAGLRFAGFFVLGPGNVYDYRTDVSRSIESRIDSTYYTSGKLIKTYAGPEVRLSARYSLGLNNSVKFSYSRIHQFLHMLTNSTAISPTDVWKISDANIKPLIGNQIAMGYYHNLYYNKIEASAEMYYKRTRNQLDYKGGTELLLNPDLEVDLLSGSGRAYGIEFLLKKKDGRLNGWISYTYSRSEIKIDGTFSDEKINNGEYYPSNYDKPHDLNLVVNFKYSRRFNFTNTLTYSTGRPITYPVAKYNFRGRELIHYSMRNEYRIPDYFRWDISLNINGNLKSNKLADNSWSVGVYNVTGRNNAYSVFFKTTGQGIKGYQLSVFARPIFNLTYNFKF